MQCVASLEPSILFSHMKNHFCWNPHRITNSALIDGMKTHANSIVYQGIISSLCKRGSTACLCEQCIDFQISEVPLRDYLGGSPHRISRRSSSRSLGNRIYSQTSRCFCCSQSYKLQSGIVFLGCFHNNGCKSSFDLIEKVLFDPWPTYFADSCQARSHTLLFPPTQTGAVQAEFCCDR